MTTVLNGLVGGALVAVVATFAVHLVDPTRARAATETPTADRVRAFLVPVLYGSAAGGVLIALELLVLDHLAVPPTVGEAFSVAVPWGILLLLASLVVWRFGLGGRSDKVQPRTLVVYHVILAVGLGVWIRVTWIT